MIHEDASPAYIAGHEAGKNAASWVFDGNTTRETYEHVLKGIEDVDPMVMDMYRVPDLSGEWADGMTPDALINELGIDPYSDDADTACDEWEQAVWDGFWEEVERVARYQLDPIDQEV